MIPGNIRDQLIRDEGVKLTAYKDIVGKTTIGVGRNLDDVGISLSEANLLLDTDICRATEALLLALPWVSTLAEPRRGVLINMAFNLGIKGLLGFTNTLSLIKSGKYLEASVEMLKSKWATQVGERAVRLSDQMATGIWH